MEGAGPVRQGGKEGARGSCRAKGRRAALADPHSGGWRRSPPGCRIWTPRRACPCRRPEAQAAARRAAAAAVLIPAGIVVAGAIDTGKQVGEANRRREGHRAAAELRRLAADQRPTVARRRRRARAVSRRQQRAPRSCTTSRRAITADARARARRRTPRRAGPPHPLRARRRRERGSAGGRRRALPLHRGHRGEQVDPRLPVPDGVRLPGDDPLTAEECSPGARPTRDRANRRAATRSPSSSRAPARARCATSTEAQRRSQCPVGGLEAVSFRCVGTKPLEEVALDVF